MTYTVDLHTHSILSYDGGIGETEYSDALKKKQVDVVAITDHNEIDFALHLHHKLGKTIIVGEEIETTDGEIIGLFLHKKIPKGLCVEETIAQIKMQKGLVYIPHPFERRRKGLSLPTLTRIASSIDIIETFNARAVFENKSQEADNFAKKFTISKVAASDAHDKRALGCSAINISQIPKNETLCQLIDEGLLRKKTVSLQSLCAPFFNKLNHLIRSTK